VVKDGHGSVRRCDAEAQSSWVKVSTLIPVLGNILTFPFTFCSNSLPALQSADAKKEEFRRYLEKSGVIDALTKVLVGLYEEPDKPPSAVDYIRKYLGTPSNVDVDALRSENDELKARIKELTRSVDDLKSSLKEARS